VVKEPVVKEPIVKEPIVREPIIKMTGQQAFCFSSWYRKPGAVSAGAFD